jgi:hypothetical protein
MDILTNLIDGACETLTARYEEYKRGNGGSGEGFDSTSAIYLTADGESRGLSADERLALLAENPGWLCRDHEELPGRSGLVTISINDLLHDILVEHLVDALGSHYSSLQGEERDRRLVALQPDWAQAIDDLFATAELLLPEGPQTARVRGVLESARRGFVEAVMDDAKEGGSMSPEEEAQRDRDRRRALLPEWVRTAYKALWEVEADHIPTEATEVIGHLIAARTALLAGTGVEPWELPS